MKLSVSKNENRRVQMPASRQATIDGSDDVEIAVDVRKPSYVPTGVTVRARVTDLLFTGITKAWNLTNLEHDPEVKSVQVGRALHNSVNGG
jgi:hypothetical protein